MRDNQHQLSIAARPAMAITLTKGTALRITTNDGAAEGARPVNRTAFRRD